MTKEITSEQVLYLAKRVEIQRAEKARLEATKESKEFDTLKTTNQESNGPNNAKRSRKVLLDNHKPHTSHTSAQHVALVVQDVADLIILIEYARAQVERC